MDVIEAIRNRHSVKRLIAPGPTPAQIETLLELGGTAPDHGGLRPWRHVVLSGADLAAFPLDAGDSPTVIVVGLEPSGDKISVDDQAAAVAASAQLILLAASAMGLGAMWRTGSAARDPRVRAAAGLSPAGRIVAFVHVGTPADARMGTTTTSVERAPERAAVSTTPLPAAPVAAAPSRADGDLGIGSLRGR